jgi:methylenetetrahydrofolate reductase (NADPH)
MRVEPRIPVQCATSPALTVSFELFPPRSSEASAQLWQTMRRLEPLMPRFVSVTYGAGGTTREATRDTVLRLRRETRLEPAAHLTCVGATRCDIETLAADYWAAGIRHIVAIRGDPPAGADGYQAYPGGVRRAAELVACLKRVADFEVSVAAFPETHPEAASPQEDLDNLKRKFDAGATRAISQFFFDAPVYLRFVERARRAGIEGEIVPGILPVTNFAQMVNFARRCGTSVPSWLARLFDGLDDDPATRELVAATVAAEQCLVLAAQGVREFHFYTLNRPHLTLAVCRLLGLRPETEQAAAFATA